MSDVSTAAAICLRSDSQLRTGSCTCGEVHAGVSEYENIDSLPSGQLDTQVHTTCASPCSHWILHRLSEIVMNVPFTFVINNLLTATCTCYVCFCPYVFAYARLCVCVEYVSCTHPTIVGGTETQGKQKDRPQTHRHTNLAEEKVLARASHYLWPQVTKQIVWQVRLCLAEFLQNQLFPLFLTYRSPFPAPHGIAGSLRGCVFRDSVCDEKRKVKSGVCA